jgi:type 1 glutamine amidotransferase
MKRIIIILLISIISQNSISSQYLKDKKILIVWGGYKPHQPKLFTKIVSDWLKTQKAYISESNDLGIYSNYDSLIKFDLIIQSVTMMDLSNEQEKNLTMAVENGVGIAGSHGGLGDSFRANTGYQFMIGGQFVKHPGGKVNFNVKMLKNKLTVGLKDFDIYSEQYYMHYDPNIDIIATTKFNGEPYPWIKDVVMPVAWRKNYGKGKVFYISIGHDPNEFSEHPDGWELLKRGIEWATRN